MDANSEKEPQKYPLVTTELTLFLFSLGMFAAMPTTDNLILTKVCLNHFNDTQQLYNISSIDFCRNSSNAAVGDNNYVQTYTSRWIMYMQMVNFIPAFIAVLFAGSWGDKFGRKFPVLIPPPGFIVCTLILGVFDLFIEELPIYIIIIAQFCLGLSGGEVIMVATCYSYVATISNPLQRIRRLSIVESMIITATMLGPLISLGLRNLWGNYAVYFFSSSCALLAFLYTLIFIKNIKPEKKTKATFGTVFDYRNVKDSITVLIRSRSDNKRKYVFIMFFSIAVYFFISSGNGSLMYQFVKEHPFSWNYRQFVTLLSVLGAITGFCLLIVFPLIRKAVNIADSSIAILAISSVTIGTIIFGFARTETIIYIASAIGVLGGFTPVACRTIASKVVDHDEEGKIFSILAIGENTGTLLGATLYNAIWPYTRNIFRGTTYEMSAGFLFITLCLIMFVAFLSLCYNSTKLLMIFAEKKRFVHINMNRNKPNSNSTDIPYKEHVEVF